MADQSFQQYLSDPQNQVTPQAGVADQSAAVAFQAADNLAKPFTTKENLTAIFGTKKDTDKFDDPALMKYTQDVSAIKASYDQGQSGSREVMSRLGKVNREFNQLNPQYIDKTGDVRKNVFGNDPLSQPDQFDTLQNRLQRAVEDTQIKAVGTAVEQGKAIYKSSGEVDALATWTSLQKQGQLQAQVDASKNATSLNKDQRDAVDLDLSDKMMQQFSTNVYGLATRLQSLTSSADQAFAEGSTQARSQIGEYTTQYKQFATSYKDDLILQASKSGMTPDKVTAMGTAFDKIIESQTSGTGIMDSEVIKQSESLQAKFGVTASQLAPSLAILKSTLGPQSIASIVDTSIASKPEFAAVLEKQVSDAVDKLGNQGNTGGITTLKNTMDYVGGKKTIDQYDVQARPDVLKHSGELVKNLNNQVKLHPTDLQTWKQTNLNLSTLANQYEDTQSRINMGKYFSYTNFASQYEKSASSLDPADAEKLGRSVGNGLAVSMGSLNQKILGAGTQAESPMTSGSLAAGTKISDNLPIPLTYQFNATNGYVQMVDNNGKPLTATPSQAQDIKDMNGMLDTLSRTQTYSPVFGKMTPIQIKEVAMRSMQPDIAIKGESTIDPIINPKEGKSQSASDIYASALQSPSEQNLNTAGNSFLEDLRGKEDQLRVQQQQTVEQANAGSNATDQPSLMDTQAMIDSKNEEGLKLTSYTDSTGNVTVGHGFNMDANGAAKTWKDAGITANFTDVKAGKAQITPEDATKLFEVKKAQAYESGAKLLPNWQSLSANRKEVVADLIYNMGEGKEADKNGPATGVRSFKTTLSLIAQGKYQAAADSLMKSAYAKQVPFRAKRNAEMLANDLDRQAAQETLNKTGSLPVSKNIG